MDGCTGSKRIRIAGQGRWIMATWPAGLPPPSWGISEEIYKPQNKIEFEANYTQSRPKGLRGRRRMPDFAWKILTEAEYQILEAFFLANQGGSFDWTHPITGVVRTFCFSGDSIKHKWTSPGYRHEVQCPIEEM